MFMIPVVEYDHWQVIEDWSGETRVVPFGYADSEDTVIEEVNGYCARMSAPGYLDATEWIGPYDTAAEAARDLEFYHRIDDPLFEPEDERGTWENFLFICADHDKG